MSQQETHKDKFQTHSKKVLPEELQKPIEPKQRPKPSELLWTPNRAKQLEQAAQQ